MYLLKRVVKKIPVLFRIVIYLFEIIQNIKGLGKNNERKLYYSNIENIKKNKKIILDIKFGGLGDWLVYTSLPRLLKEKYDIDFYISKNSIDLIRNLDIFKICFETNPYFKEITHPNNTDVVFEFKIFSVDKKKLDFIFNLKKESITEIIEGQFNISDIGNGLPEIYYEPQLLREFSNIILIDKNYMSGKKLGWLYNEESFIREAKKYSTENNTLQYIDPSKQDLYKYIDMVYSCKHFITVLSGGAALATFLNKQFTVILPYNVFGGSVDQFIFKKSKAKYIK